MTVFTAARTGGRSISGMSDKSIDHGAQAAYGCRDWPTWR
jgi:hypothetical protein